jgi:DNA-binding CsgD family transcriptional regulator
VVRDIIYAIRGSKLLATFRERWCERAGTLIGPQQSLADSLRTTAVGVAICDRQLRFQAINQALASMNGIPADAHIGKKLHQILGNVAAKVEPAFQHVFVTGEPLSNFKLTGQLPTRTGTGHWIENYYPIRNESRRVLQVVAVVLEIRNKKSIERALRRITKQLRITARALETARGTSGRLNHWTKKQAELLARPRELLEDCISQARTLSELLNPPLRSAVMPHRRASFHPELVQIPVGNLLAPRSSRWISDLNAERLSHRERQVVRFLAEGKSNKEMAGILEISIRTVETYRARTMLKLDLHSIAELVRYAVRNNMI